MEALFNRLEAGWINQLMLSYAWSWPISETLHFLGLCLLVGALLIMDLRLLGFERSISLSAVHKLMPVAIIGFVVNLLTGLSFFLAVPRMYAYNWSFQIKMALVLLAGVNFLVYYWKVEPALVRNGPTAAPTPLAKIVGAVSLLAWFGVLCFGRLLPYLGNSGG
jgi:Family of unknown function (DUF6644)